MNKYYILGIILVILIIVGISYQNFFGVVSHCPENVTERVVEMRSLKNQWKFEPNPVVVNKCEKVTLKIFNEDEYDHGFAIDLLGINKRLPPLTTTEVTFTANQAGTFPFYCSIPCGEGHYEQKGILVVEDPWSAVSRKP